MQILKRLTLKIASLILIPLTFAALFAAITSSQTIKAVDKSVGEEHSEGSFQYHGKTIKYRLEVLNSTLNFPWSLAFLPDGGLIISERSGSLRIWRNEKLSQSLSGLPPVFVKSQGGLLDLVLHPEYKRNQRVFLSYAHGVLEQNATRVISAKIQKNSLVDVKTIYTVAPWKNTPVHYGGRMAILPDNTLLLTSGDGFDFREKAQRLNSALGKVIRINFDGSIPKDNPFVFNPTAKAEIFSYGHRNPQAILFDPVRKQIITHEHGPAGGDEINIIEAGKNYGWPVITFGKDYSGAQVTPYQEYPGMEQPLLHWTPSIAPSGMAVYYGSEFPELEGDLLASTLVGQEIRLVDMEQNRVISQISLFKELSSRFRDVRVGPDGAIYLLTDSEQGKLIKVTRLED